MTKILQIDFVSPLPPVRSGIADYSADLLPELAKVCDVRVVHLSGQPISEKLVETWSPVETREVGKGPRLPLYQMGNNHYHEEVLQLALRNPGVLTLHDIFLHHLLIERSLAKRKLPPYRKQLTHDHGWIGRAVALPPRWGAYANAPLFALPTHRRLVQSQRGILVHSQWGKQVVHDEAGDIEVRVIPMPMPVSRAATAKQVADLRASHGIPLGAPLLGSFGFQTPIKRTDVVIRALARPGMQAVHLLVVGEVAEQLDLERDAREAGVRDRLHISGYVSRKELRVAMSAADLCVNLRYPTAGETSASLLRLFAQGRPAIVSDYAQFGDLPSEVALRVPLGTGEEEALASQVSSLLADPQRLREMGRAARKMIRQEHAPERVATAVVDALLELAKLDPPSPKPAVPSPPTTLTWSEISGTLTVAGLEEPWPEGTARRLTIRMHNTGHARWLAGHKGDGAVVLEIQLRTSDRDHLALRPWPGLPIDLSPGESTEIQVLLRRPIGPCTIRVEPHVLGVSGFSTLGGPSLEQEI